MGLFQTLEIGKRALLTQQLTMSTIGQNISNVDTPGYSRQRVIKSTADPLRLSIGVLGMGVEVRNVLQVRDLFLGDQFRQENKSFGNWQFREKLLSQIETMFNEPGDDSLRSHVDAFFDAFSQLTNGPESITNRTDLLSKASTMVSGFHQLSEKLNELKTSIDRDLSIKILEVNEKGKEIASLNQEIVRIEIGGVVANDLRDRRDLLVDELSKIVDINTIEDTDGSVRVSIGAMAIVDKSESIEIEARAVTVRGEVRNQLYYKGSDQIIKNLDGELKGLVDIRDITIPSYLARLDDMALTMATEVNKIHAAGFGLRTGSSAFAPTGTNFFSVNSDSAKTIAISDDIKNDVTLIAASQSGEPGDASNALLLSRLRNVKIMNSASATFNEFYGSLLGSVGVAARDSVRFTQNFELVVQQIRNARESVQGVSLDEEMTNLIMAQRSYDAAARVITSADQALDTVINGMGVVGR